MKVSLVTLVILLAAILSPLTAAPRIIESAPEYVVIEDDEAGTSTIVDRISFIKGNYSGGKPVSGIDQYGNGYGGGSNFSAAQEQRVDAEGFSIGANVKLGKLGRVNLGYAKATQKAKAKVESQSRSSQDEACVAKVGGSDPTQIWLVDVESNQPICPITIDRLERLQQFKSEIAIDRIMSDKKKKEIVCYKVMGISDDVASVTLIKGQAGPQKGDKIIFVIVTKEGVAPEKGDELRVRY